MISIDKTLIRAIKEMRSAGVQQQVIPSCG